MVGEGMLMSYYDRSPVSIFSLLNIVYSDMGCILRVWGMFTE